MITNKYKSLIILTLILLLSGCGNKNIFQSDSDADGIADKHDKCPEIKGLPEYHGCPDTDGDGIPDKEDPCPRYDDPYGCADADGDNVPDPEDACPDRPGPPGNDGCPYPETAGLVPPLEMPVFPLPAPTPSDAETVSRSYFEDAETLEDVREIISEALQENGYYREGYFWVKGGFAIATQLEQTDENGNSFSGRERWVDEIIYRDLKEKFSLSRYFKRLFNAQPGYYRCIVFVVTTHSVTYEDTNLEPDIVDDGSSHLPSEIGDVVYNNQFTVTALIYQFKKLENEKNAKFIKPSTIPGQHLLRSGIKNSLR